MTFNELTSEEQAVLLDWLNDFRATMGELARVNNHCEAAKTMYWGLISAILAKLDDADTVPNTGGLTGAVSLTKAEITTLLSYVDEPLTVNTDPHRQAIGKACGGSNLIG